ncbi:MAG: YdcF family protein [Planctomycetota bacterium]
MRELLKLLILPPLAPLLLVVAAALLRRRPRVSRVLAIAGFLSLWLLSTPWMAWVLLAGLQRDPALDPAALPGAEAIVVLSADHVRAAPEFGGDTVGPMTLERLRYGARLHRACGRPLLVSGGVVGTLERPHAELMRDVLEGEWGVTVRWLESNSRNTFENARESAALLAEAGIDRVYLVTHAWHLPRATASFARFGVDVVPAPTGFRGPPHRFWRGLLPSWSGLRDCSLGLHEWIGRLWYACT